MANWSLPAGPAVRPPRLNAPPATEDLKAPVEPSGRPGDRPSGRGGHKANWSRPRRSRTWSAQVHRPANGGQLVAPSRAGSHLKLDRPVAPILNWNSGQVQAPAGPPPTGETNWSPLSPSAGTDNGGRRL